MISCGFCAHVCSLEEQRFSWLATKDGEVCALLIGGTEAAHFAIDCDEPTSVMQGGMNSGVGQVPTNLARPELPLRRSFKSGETLTLTFASLDEKTRTIIGALLVECGTLEPTLERAESHEEQA